MAKKKMTLEEKLEKSIVKDVSYEVPENWVWTNLEVIFDNITSSKKKLKQKEYESECKEGYIEVIDQGESFIGGYTDKKELAYDGELPIIIFGDHSKCIKFVDFNFVQGADGVKVLLPKGMNRRYLYYMMKNLKLPDKGYSRHYKFLREEPMPIAPLREQQRIVDKIESLFKKLDKAKELIEEARDDFEKRKSAITSKAFRGKLNTRNGCMRLQKELEGYYDIPDNWRWLKLKDVCERITDGTHKSPKSYLEGKYKYVTAKNIKEWGIDLSNITYLTQEDHETIYSRCDVRCGDVLYIKDGATTGIATVNDLEEEFSLLSSVAMLRVNSNLINKYLVYALNSNEIKTKILESVKGVAITRLTLKKINEIIIPVAPIEEQKEIVRILDNLLEEEAKIKELTQLEEEIELIKKSILAKAFRGQLGTNCKEDESALDLLKVILSKK